MKVNKWRLGRCHFRIGGPDGLHHGQTTFWAVLQRHLCPERDDVDPVLNGNFIREKGGSHSLPFGFLT